MVEGTKKASWENVKFLIMTSTFIKPDKPLLTRFDLISRFAKQDTQGLQRAGALGQESRTAEQPCFGASFRASLEGQKLMVRSMVRGGRELAEQLFSSQSLPWLTLLPGACLEESLQVPL